MSNTAASDFSGVQMPMVGWAPWYSIIFMEITLLMKSESQLENIESQLEF